MMLRQSGEYYKQGVGKIFTVNVHDSPEVAKVKVGDVIEIDNHNWEIVGIETYTKLMYPPVPGDNYGLIVKKV